MAKTIIDLFESKEFQSKNLSPGFADAPPSPMVVEPLLDKFASNDIYKFGTNYSKIKSDKETFVGTELSGIRIRSAVELNNPLIYGNESIRIVNRTTSTVEDMKQQTGGEAADGGLIGKGLSKLTGGKVSSISQARDAVNSKLGIPSNPIPSRLIGDIGKLPSTEPITKDNVGEGLQGTGLGNFLKDTGGGNPKDLGKQALGKGIGLAKDKLRGALFGQGQSIGDAVGDDNGIRLTYNDQNTYTKYNQEERNIFSEGGIIEDPSAPAIPFGNQSSTRIDLRKVSPVYGIGRGRYGSSPYAYIFNPDNPSKNERLPKNWPNNPRVGTTSEGGSLTPLESNYGIGNRGTGNNLDTLSPSDSYTLDDDQAFIKMGDTVYRDFIPVWFRKKGTEKPIAFRSILSGITETTSPSWSSNKFVGNPYSFYMYDGVERALSFGIKLFATSPMVLNSIWERLKILTAYAYPSISQGLTTPPIIEFRLGSMYNGKTAFIESLSYTIPDESNWETNGELGYLPKTIDVSISLKFIEQQGSEDKLYDFTISKEAAKAINEKRESNQVSGEPQTGEDSGETPPKMTPKGESKIKVVTKGIKIANPLAPKTMNMPTDLQPGKVNPIEAQSGVADKLEGKTPVESAKEQVQKQNITSDQAYALNMLALSGPKPEIVPVSSLPAFIKNSVGGVRGPLNSIIAYQKGFSKITNTEIEVWTEISSYGHKSELGYRTVDNRPQELIDREEREQRAFNAALGL